jgi:hypothetical protein
MATCRAIVHRIAGSHCHVNVPGVLYAQCYTQSQATPGSSVVLMVEFWSAGAGAGVARRVWCSWKGGRAAQPNALEVPAALAQCLDLPDGTHVTVALVLQVPLPESMLFVEPATGACAA